MKAQVTSETEWSNKTDGNGNPLRGTCYVVQVTDGAEIWEVVGDVWSGESKYRVDRIEGPEPHPLERAEIEDAAEAAVRCAR